MEFMGFVILEKAEVTQVIRRATLGSTYPDKPDHVLPQVALCNQCSGPAAITTISLRTGGKESIAKEPHIPKPCGHEGLPLSAQGDNEGESRKLHISFYQNIKITT